MTRLLLWTRESVDIDHAALVPQADRYRRHTVRPLPTQLPRKAKKATFFDFDKGPEKHVAWRSRTGERPDPAAHGGGRLVAKMGMASCLRCVVYSQGNDSFEMEMISTPSPRNFSADD